MSNMDTLIANIDPNKRTITKEEMRNLIIESMRQIGEINEAYKKAFEGSDEQSGLFIEIEEKLKQIRIAYEENFVSLGENGKTKLVVLDEKIQEINLYHRKLTGGEDSIENDIADSQKNITEFYKYLFTSETDGEDRHSQVKAAIERIVQFDKKTQGDGGYRKAIEDAHSIIIEKYADLYEQKDENGKTKIENLEESIVQINSFDKKLHKEVEPFLDKIKKEITTKKDEVNALLSGATGGSLVQGYLQSKNEYKQLPEYQKIEGNYSRKLVLLFNNFVLFLTSIFGIIFEYILFILPLIIAVSIFVRPDLVATYAGGGETLGEYFKNLDFLSRVTISLPLWWISWFGQRSISHKRRLAEEYNHKAQVAKMYLNFSSRETQGAYPISKTAKEKLDLALMKAIGRHPGQIFGKDETMLDKILQAIKATRGISDNNSDEKNIGKENVGE